MKVGDKVDIVWTEAMLVSLERGIVRLVPAGAIAAVPGPSVIPDARTSVDSDRRKGVRRVL